jgi:excisionase family DNA binding protein
MSPPPPPPTNRPDPMHRFGLGPRAPREAQPPAKLDPEQPMLTTLPEAARQLGLSTRTLERMIAEGKISTVKVGRARRIRVRDVIAIAEHGLT